MRTQKQMWVGLAALVVLAVGTSVWAASPATLISIGDLECQGCAKKVAAQLSAVPGVAAVQPNVPAKTASVMPKPNTVLSPRALWEAVEKAGKQPVKLEGPSGTFTAKPQS